MIGDLAEALSISQDLLDRTGDALMTGKFDAFAQCFSCPTVIDTFDGQVSLNTTAEIKACFENVRDFHRQNVVTDMVRHIVETQWFDDATIHTTHQSRILAGTELIKAPYIVFSILKRHGDRWLITFSQYAIADSNKLNSALLGATTSREGITND